ncbi:MAG: hypothetical protein JNL74_05520, partial [Fibrobacteres bacterium]|nr:hypothetical protein [Fibrobacterota bacterium]
MKKILTIVAITALCSLSFGQAKKKAAPTPAPAPVAAEPAPAPTPEPTPVPAAEPAPVTTTSNNGAILESAEAAQNASLAEAGKYERKSVTYIDALWLMDEKAKTMTSEQVSYMLKKIKDRLTMPRFDYNPLPEAISSAFVAKANQSSELTLDNISAIMDEVVVPKILEIVDLNKELRAQNYTTEAQRNSFYATKAKEYGFTDVELAKIMNSAFIYIPLVSGFSYKKGDYEQYQCKMGVVWYRISTKGEKAKAIKVVADLSSSMGSARKNRVYATMEGPVTSPTFAFRSMVKNGARNTLAATQAMPEFRLSGQILDKEDRTVGFDLGKKEGIRVDDKYDICEFEEKEDGSIKETKSGWVVVSSVADTNSKQGYKSNAYVVAGEPMTGAVLSEFPRLNIDVALKFRTWASGTVKVDRWVTDPWPPHSVTEDSSTGMGMGMQIDARYNIGRRFGVQQLFLGLGWGMGSGETNGGIEVFAIKHFRFMGRFTAGPEVGFSLTGPDGLYFGGDVGYALTPSIKAEGGLRYAMSNTTNNQDGISFNVGIVYSPA